MKGPRAFAAHSRLLIVSYISDDSTKKRLNYSIAQNNEGGALRTPGRLHENGVRWAEKRRSSLLFSVTGQKSEIKQKI
jgi:hypothetical protein